MKSYPFLKMAAATAKYYFRFRICWCHCLQKVKVYQQTKFCRDISIGGWDITISVFEIQTSAMMEFYFGFVHDHFAVICMLFCIMLPNFVQIKCTHCGNMTSYPFLKMAAATTKYYFQFRICWCHCLQKVKVYQQTKFRRDISIGGWDITTSGFQIQTSAILEFYFRFWSRPVHRNLHVILHHATKFRPNQSTHCRNMTLYPFLNMAAATAKYKYYFCFRICWCHCL